MTIAKQIDALKVSGRNPQWNDPQYIIPSSQDAKKLRGWQKSAFHKLKNEQFVLVAAFCGSGKSIVQIALAIHDIVRSEYTQKQLVIVPQQHIGYGFVGEEDLEYITLMVNSKRYEWKVNHDFCNEHSTKVIRGLKQWLLADAKSLVKNNKGRMITGLNAVASHQALAMVWKKLTPNERERAIKNLTLRVDEAHHIKGVFDSAENGLSDEDKVAMEIAATNLGRICRFIIDSKSLTSKIHLTTATPYRGDREIILSPEVRSQFSMYYLDWIEHWKTLGIEYFNIQYEEYKTDPIKQLVSRIKSEPNEKHMVVIPPTTHKWRQDGPGELKTLLEAIRRVVPKERVLDLVTRSTQAKNKALLLQEPKRSDKGESKFDVIVTCNLGREGTDWCPCSRLHNTTCENSITLAVQTMGRPFRRFGGKTTVNIYYYVKEFVKPKEGMTKRDLLTDRTNALLVCIQMDEMCHPILLPEIPSSLDECQKNNGSPKREYVSLGEILGDQYQSIKKDLITEIESLEVKSAEEIDNLIKRVLESHGAEYSEHVRDGLRALILRTLSPALKDLGIDVAFLRKEGFDAIVERYGIENLSIFFGAYSKKDWKIIRQIMKTHWDEMYALSLLKGKVLSDNKQIQQAS